MSSSSLTLNWLDCSALHRSISYNNEAKGFNSLPILLPLVKTYLFWYLMLVRTPRLLVFYSIVFACLFIWNSVLFFSRHFGIWLGIQSDCYLAYKYIFTLRSLWTLLGVCININFLASILFWFLMFLKRVELFGLLINLMFYNFTLINWFKGFMSTLNKTKLLTLYTYYFDFVCTIELYSINQTTISRIKNHTKVLLSVDSIRFSFKKWICV